MAVTFTDAEIETLRAAILAAAVSGVLSVEYDGPPKRKVTYRSIAEMQGVLDRAVAAGTTTTARTSYRLVKTSQGF